MRLRGAERGESWEKREKRARVSKGPSQSLVFEGDVTITSGRSAGSEDSTDSLDRRNERETVEKRSFLFFRRLQLFSVSTCEHSAVLLIQRG